MPASAHPAEQLIPTSEADRALVQKELEAILASYHFRGSKRYPAMLKYVVGAALDGHSSNLKERTLGVEVFGRDPDYDTSADPVVRFSASEVRKRIAQYYHDNGRGAQVQIELPLGSYVPEFLICAQEATEKQGGLEDKALSASSRLLTMSRDRYRVIVVCLAAMLLMAAIAGVFAYRKFSLPKPTISDQLWAPLVKSNGPILIVVGTSHNSNKLAPERADTTFYDHMVGPYHHVSVATAVALSNLAGVLRQHGSTYEIKEDTETSLTDLHSRTLILVGATNNAWTMRLVDPLRFHFAPGPLAQVQDAKNPESRDWAVDFFKPFSSIVTDYAIVARYHDATTEGPVMVIGGLGPYGTEAASAFVGSPQYLEQIVKQVPAGWESKDFELVIKTDVIDGKAGPPVLVSSTVW